jgi:hypothetical protein
MMMKSREALGGLLFVAALSACGAGEAAKVTTGATGGAAGAQTNGGNQTVDGGTSMGGAGAGMTSAAGAQTNGGGGAPDSNGGAGGTRAGGNSGAGGMPVAGYPKGSCSEKNLRTGPPAGKEMFKADPLDIKFPFSSHWMGAWPADTEPKLMGQTVMADLDDDGDLDFAAGQRGPILPGGMWWWERCTDDHWVAHKVGEGQASDSSGDALDVDRDGLIDIVSGDSWFKNPGKSREMEWQRFPGAGPGFNAEDLTVGDVTGDGMAEVIYVNKNFPPTWFSVGTTPQQGFKLGGKLDIPNVQQGTAWGDLNGDGMNDWLISVRGWFQNDNNGASFTERPIGAAQNFDCCNVGNAPLTYIGDIDGDGDNDFAAGSHWLGGNQYAQLAWFENVDGKGGNFKEHSLSTTGLYSHGVILADFDNDRDLDLLWARNVGPSFICDNTDGKGTFVEHEIVADFRGHTPRIGDVDCDGDLDVAGGTWGDQGPADHGEQSKPIRDYVYLRNHAVENGAPPIFDKDRKPYELGWKEKDHCR